MMANERKADHSDSLEYSASDYGKTFGWVTFQLGRDVRAFDEYRRDYNEHTDERQSRGPRKLVNISVK